MGLGLYDEPCSAAAGGSGKDTGRSEGDYLMEYYCVMCEDYWAGVGLEEATVCICCNFPFMIEAASRRTERDYTVFHPCPIHPQTIEAVR